MRRKTRVQPERDKQRLLDCPVTAPAASMKLVPFGSGMESRPRLRNLAKSIREAMGVSQFTYSPRAPE